jgi:hypothetical protein
MRKLYFSSNNLNQQLSMMQFPAMTTITTTTKLQQQHQQHKQLNHSSQPQQNHLL